MPYFRTKEQVDYVLKATWSKELRKSLLNHFSRCFYQTVLGQILPFSLNGLRHSISLPLFKSIHKQKNKIFPQRNDHTNPLSCVTKCNQRASFTLCKCPLPFPGLMFSYSLLCHLIPNVDMKIMWMETVGKEVNTGQKLITLVNEGDGYTPSLCNTEEIESKTYSSIFVLLFSVNKKYTVLNDLKIKVDF